jgi:hypothetical protein
MLMSYHITTLLQPRRPQHENKVQKRILGFMGGELRKEYRILHNDELHNLYFLHNIVRVITSRRMRMTECVGIGK